MKTKLFKIASIISVFSLSAPLIAMALDVTPPPPGVPGATVETIGADFLTLANWFVNWFFSLVLILSLLALLWGAFLFLTAGGDATKTTQARQWLLWALVGFAVAILVRTLLTMVCNFFNVDCPTGFGG